MLWESSSFLSRVSDLSSLSPIWKGNAKSSLNDFKLQRTGQREIFGKGCLATVTEIISRLPMPSLYKASLVNIAGLLKELTAKYVKGSIPIN